MAAMGESTVLEDFNTGELTKSCRYLKMKGIENLNAKTVEKHIRSLLDKDVVLETDESTTFSKFGDFIDMHEKSYQERKNEDSASWTQMAINNFKSDLIKFRWSQKESFRITYMSFALNATEDILEKDPSID